MPAGRFQDFRMTSATTRTAALGPVVGIDFGGSSIKAGAVDVAAGCVLGELVSVPTPSPSTPAAVERAIAGLVEHLPDCRGPVGFAYPGVVCANVARTAANVDTAWLGTDGAALIQRATGRPGSFLNDADAAGLAEMRLGAGRGVRGTAMMLTFGTGIGSALFVDGRLWPNTELGHLELAGGRGEAEHHASARVRAELDLDFPAWVARVNDVLAEFDRLFWPELVIVGGGVSERWSEFGPLLKSHARLVPAELRSQAGVVGAAFYAHERAARGG
jgi:polyphosphate glucokinase